MKNIAIEVACSCSSDSFGAKGTSVFFFVGKGLAVVVILLSIGVVIFFVIVDLFSLKK